MRAIKLVTTFTLAAIAGLAITIAFIPANANAAPAPNHGLRAVGDTQPNLGGLVVNKKSFDLEGTVKLEARAALDAKDTTLARAVSLNDARDHAPVRAYCQFCGCSVQQCHASCSKCHGAPPRDRKVSKLPRAISISNGHEEDLLSHKHKHPNYCDSCDCNTDRCFAECPKCPVTQASNAGKLPRAVSLSNVHGDGLLPHERDDDFCKTCDCNTERCFYECGNCLLTEASNAGNLPRAVSVSQRHGDAVSHADHDVLLRKAEHDDPHPMLDRRSEESPLCASCSCQDPNCKTSCPAKCDPGLVEQEEHGVDGLH